MRGVPPLLGAGGAFAGFALLGLGAGILLDQATGGQFYVLVGLFGGMLLGGYTAFRLLLRSME
ncbi:MAG TPA: hypothetical protein VIN40_10970 [Candidatus Tyrphobacter sp.]